jgi:hypothetical protein
MPFHWTCPYCDRDTTITNTFDSFKRVFDLKHADGYVSAAVEIIVCPNADCQKFALKAYLFGVDRVDYGGGNLDWRNQKLRQSWNLIPPSTAKVFPDYVPQPIRDDYVEACNIRELSPKASATLSRRCLQGMIRDFWGIVKPRLVDEVDALKDKTDALTWEAIDSTRKIGNIGAHMEKDINLIIDVDAEEADLLIWLIELLVKDWYITRHQRQERLQSIVMAKDAKDAAKNSGSKSQPSKVEG